MTLEDLAKRFKKRPETFSRLFTRMEIKKGSGAAEAAKKITEMAEARSVSEAEETLQKIAKTRREHYQMSGVLAKIAYSEIVRCREAKTDIGALKDVMVTLKMAGEVIGNARKELFAVLDVEKYAKSEELDDLPELTVRELTTEEMSQLQNQSATDEMGTDFDTGESMLPADDFPEGT